MTINPNDPLGKPTSGPMAARTLFDNLSKVATGFTAEDVSAAAINLLVNAIRQVKPTRAGAAASFDELAAKAKTILLDQHYDLTGKRRNVFPFDQVVTPEHADFKSKVGRT